MKFRHLLSALALCALPGLAPARAGAVPPAPFCEARTRLIVISDIGNEPDDQMSFVRLLLYSNEIDIEGLIAGTSTWLRNKPRPEKMHALIAAYGKVRPRLMANAPSWPETAALDALVVPGQTGYGMAAVGPDKMSAGAQAIIRAADRPDPRPLWISLWGGANTLAQALTQLRATRSPEQIDAFIAKLRVYAISDQDDAGYWLRREFPALTYIVSPSMPDNGNYASATWTGISGDFFYRNGAGADASTISGPWLETHIRRGPLGMLYPKPIYIMEGDTPAFLGFTNNGLASHCSPSWGGWGGRYLLRQPYGETRPVWTQGGDPFGRVTSADTVTGADGNSHTSDQATIWRWRTAFQNDFAARIGWTVDPPGKTNHAPVAVVNGIRGTGPILIDAEAGKPLALDAAASVDPDRGQHLRFRWWHYAEAGFSPGQAMADVRIDRANRARAILIPTAACRQPWLPIRRACASGVAHIILEVTDNGTPALTSYRRVIVTVRPKL